MLEPVRRIGNYEVVAHLKSGGMATLYLGRRSGAAGFSRHVAIKVIHPHLANDPTFVRMFLDEAFLSARIQHPNVVHVEELGDANGMYYLVMEYVHGCSLSGLLRALAHRNRRLAPELAVAVSIQIADGLHAAHETKSDKGEPLNVVHRDVSPQNVLLSYGGHVKLIDFGIAKARTRAQQTATRSLKGKLRYMAPEQGFGRPVDRRTDVYALGIVLWETLTMRRLFDADDDFALLDQVRSPKIPPPSRYAKGLPPALDAAVMKALATDPAVRWPSMQDFRRALVDAMPASTTLDASHLAELLGAVMSGEMAKQREALPDSLSAIAITTARPEQALARTRPSDTPVSMAPQDVIQTLTAQADNIALGDDDEGPASAVGPSVITRSSGRPPPQRRPLPWIIAGGAGVAALIGLGVAVGMQLGSDEPPRPVAAPPAPPTAPPPAVEIASPAPTPPAVPAAVPDAGPAAPIAELTPDEEPGGDEPRPQRRIKRRPTKRRQTGGDDQPSGTVVNGVPIVDDEDF